ncbi:MAG TPA: hypothetical protein VL330_01455 [Actinomycetes bacterium]|nr:hypothetical protein [Actinomycetes bacterium]
MNLYRFIEAEKTQQRTLKRACGLLEVSRAAYYANRADSPSTRQLVDQSSASTSAKHTRGPRAATAPRGSTRNCAVTATATAASGSRG